MIRRIVALAALALAAAPSARAETARQPSTATSSNAVSIGFGVGIEPLGIFSPNTSIAAPGADFYVPIQIGQQLRIEPSIGFRHFGQNGSSENAWALGVGGLFYITPPTPTGFYVGGRLGLAHFASSAGTLDTSATDFSIAPVLGGEYAFAPRFTFGAELQLPITFYGNHSQTQGGVTTTVNDDRSGVATNAVIFVRYFFM